jgi:hypothetical protein
MFVSKLLLNSTYFAHALVSAAFRTRRLGMLEIV